jgi:hypothetical protein
MRISRCIPTVIGAVLRLMRLYFRAGVEAALGGSGSITTTRIRGDIGLVVEAELGSATGTIEREAAQTMVSRF